MRILITLIIAAMLLSVGCNQDTPQKKVQAALENLLKKSPEDNKRMLDNHNIPITWKFGHLQGLTLATTTIYSDRAEIVFDWEEIMKDRERLEPVIAHELNHIHDAFFVYGVPKFKDIVESERNIQWKDRTLERSAIIQENATRAYLLSMYGKEFQGMSPIRGIR